MFACNWQQPLLNDWISRREENGHRQLFHYLSPLKYGTRLGSNLQPLDLQSNTNLQSDMLPTALSGWVELNVHTLWSKGSLISICCTTNVEYLVPFLHFRTCGFKWTRACVISFTHHTGYHEFAHSANLFCLWFNYKIYTVQAFKAL